MKVKIKTHKIQLPFTYSATSTICPHCSNEHVTYVINRDDDGNISDVWPQVGGYCYMCGKDTKEKK